MSTLQAIILGIVQGLTEFLPVSSSGHLVLVPWWLGWEIPGLAFDTLLHWGTLVAVLVYFWRDWWEMFLAVLNRFRGRPTDGKDRLLGLILLGSIPAAVIGFSLENFFESLFNSPAAVAFFMILTGFILVFAERWSGAGSGVERLRVRDAVFIGFGQAMAIAPGISRSGSTISAGLLRGLNRPAAARFSFLLGTPIIFGAGLFKLKDLVEVGAASGSDTTVLIAGFLAAAISGFICIGFLMRYLQNHTLYIFAIWVWLVAAVTLVRFYVM